MEPKIIIAIIFGILIIGIVIWSRTPNGKGALGEFKVKLLLGKTKEGKQYVLNNYMVVDEGKSSQIDHIVINPYGLFVIETKNYSGRIYGNENQHEWTQVLNYGKVKNRFYNPIKQNATHIYRINKIINNKTEIKSLIVFVQNNTKYIQASNVIPLYSLKKSLKNSNKILSEEQMKSIYQDLNDSKANKDISKKTHIKNINQMKKNIEDGICPRCGGKLVERKSRHGLFLGCENFPKCKFTKK